jgi:tetratricopeptide (TPR) repeat protein
MLTSTRISLLTLLTTLSFAQSAPNLARPTTTQATPTDPTQRPQPIFISGKVTLSNGSEPPGGVAIERVCTGNRVRPEGFADYSGSFSLQLGQALQIGPDASEIMVDPSPSLSSNVTPGVSSSATDPYFGCELRAKLAGYRSTTITIAGRRPLDNPNVGTLILYPTSSTDGRAISATSAAASKDARKAFEKGISESRKQKFDSAEKELRKAVELHPKYAEAWLELSKTYTSLKRLPEAREAASKAVAADPQCVYPYEQLYRIAFEQANWRELADTTDRLLRLDPSGFPSAYYFNGVAHYQLQNYAAAEKSLRQAVAAGNTDPKAHYVLGLALMQKRDYAAATKSFTTFTNLAPNDPLVPKVKTTLEQIEKATRGSGSV